MPAKSPYRAAFKQHKANTQKTLRLITSDVAIEIAESLVIKTPIDTSRAEANWVAALNMVPQEFDEAKRNSGGNRINLDKAKALAKRMKLGDVFVMANSTPYIFLLNDGSSTQAPNGMTPLTIAAFPRMVERAVQRRASD